MIGEADLEVGRGKVIYFILIKYTRHCEKSGRLIYCFIKEWKSMEKRLDKIKRGFGLLVGFKLWEGD